jgi:hypothetical protein
MFCRLSQDGTGGGILSLDRLPDETEATIQAFETKLESSLGSINVTTGTPGYPPIATFITP